MESMYIGSGDVYALMSGKHTKTHNKLLQRFVSGEAPVYNALLSPIDALRTGAILEDRFARVLGDEYYPQYKEVSKEMDVFRASIDFAKLNNGAVTDFIELKTVNFVDFVNNIEPIKNNDDEAVSYVKNKHKRYYDQIQEQLFCTELESCCIVFLSVYSYVDEENYQRDIKSNEWVSIRIYRDEPIISKIKERGRIFQSIKDYYCNVNKKPTEKLPYMDSNL